MWQSVDETVDKVKDRILINGFVCVFACLTGFYKTLRVSFERLKDTLCEIRSWRFGIKDYFTGYILKVAGFVRCTIIIEFQRNGHEKPGRH